MIIGVIGFVEVREDWQEVQRGNWAQTHASFGPLVFFFFFSILCYFSLLIYIYRYYMCYGATDGPTGGYNKKNGPKRACIVSFGPFIIFLYYYLCFLIYTDHITHFYSYY